MTKTLRGKQLLTEKPDYSVRRLSCAKTDTYTPASRFETDLIVSPPLTPLRLSHSKCTKQDAELEQLFVPAIYTALAYCRVINVTIKSVNIAVVEGKTITEATELRSNPQGKPVRIKAVTNGKYILAEGDNGFAPENITIKRVGKDLYIALEETDPDQPQVIIEGFFDTQGQLVGVDEDGNYYEYISSDADQTHRAAFLMEGVSSPQVLGGSN